MKKLMVVGAVAALGSIGWLLTNSQTQDAASGTTAVVTSEVTETRTQSRSAGPDTSMIQGLSAQAPVPASAGIAGHPGIETSAGLPVVTAEYPQSPVPVVVPASYPVEEAARYYLPADQRRPGNLGGPPPLPDLAKAQNGIAPPMGITPPAAPPAQ